MEEKSTGQGGLTRRNYIRYGGTALGAGMPAGYASDSLGSDETTTAAETTTEAATETSAKMETQTTEADSSHSVTIEPIGGVTFDSVPEPWATYDGGYTGMTVVLGVGDGLTGVGGAGRYHTYVYDEPPGVSVGRKQIEVYPEVRTKEGFYELDSDVHLYGPNISVNWFSWDQTGMDEIAENVAPSAGNLVFRRLDGWYDYRYYTLYEALEEVTQALQCEDRYETFEVLHDKFTAEIQAELPPANKRPNVFLTFEGTTKPETFLPYRLSDKDMSKKQWNDLDVTDALSGTSTENLSTTNHGELDYENLLEIDPDVIPVHGHERRTSEELHDTTPIYMEGHPAGGELAAIQNGRVYRDDYLFQGSTHNLFPTERAMKQLYPDVFDDATDDAGLFDCQRVAGIVNEEF